MLHDPTDLSALDQLDSAWPIARYEDGRIVIDHGSYTEVFPNLDDMKSDPLYRMDEDGWIYIYALADPLDGSVRYIGKSIRPSERLTNHCNEKARCHRTNWIKSIIAQGRRPVMGILDRLHPCADWKTAERRWIKYAREVGWNLVNETDGGDGVLNLSDAAKAKLSQRFKGKPLSEEHRKKCGTMRGKKHSDATKAKMSRAHKGRIFTEEWRKKISEALTGSDKGRHRKVTPEQAEEIRCKIKGGAKNKDVALEYRISTRTVWLICSGRWCPTTIGKEGRNTDVAR